MIDIDGFAQAKLVLNDRWPIRVKVISAGSVQEQDFVVALDIQVFVHAKVELFFGLDAIADLVVAPLESAELAHACLDERAMREGLRIGEQLLFAFDTKRYS